MDKIKKSITLNLETKQILEILAKKLGIPENAVISTALHKLNKELL